MEDLVLVLPRGVEDIGLVLDALVPDQLLERVLDRRTVRLCQAHEAVTCEGWGFRV